MVCVVAWPRRPFRELKSDRRPRLPGRWVRPCQENHLWEASPTPISLTTTNRCGFITSLRGRRPLPQIFRQSRWVQPINWLQHLYGKRLRTGSQSVAGTRRPRNRHPSGPGFVTFSASTHAETERSPFAKRIGKLMPRSATIPAPGSEAKSFCQHS